MKNQAAIISNTPTIPTVIVPVKLLEQAAAALAAYAQLLDITNTITATIKHLAANQYLIKGQADLLSRLIEEIDSKHDANEQAYRLYRLMEQQQKAA